MGYTPESTADLGHRGEDIACRWLEENGFRIIGRNCRCGHLETDIIARRNRRKADGAGKAESIGDRPEEYASLFRRDNGGEDDRIHFIEVKMRRRGSAVSPEMAVDFRKRRMLVKAADGYVRRNRIKAEAVFDIVAINYSGEDYSVEFIENAFGPEWITSG